MGVHRRRGEQHDDQRRRLRQRQEREQPDVHEGRAPPRVHLRLAARVVALERPLLAPERLHDADAGEPFLQRRQRLGDAVADRVVRAARAVVEAPARRDEDRQRDQRDQRELRRQEREHDDREHDLQRAAGDLDERLPHELVERLHVGRQARDEDARALLLEEAERQSLQLVEGRAAQRVQEPLAGPRGQEDLRPHDQRLDQRQHEEDERGDVERCCVVLR